MPVSICLLIFNANDRCREKWLDAVQEGFDSSSKVVTVADFLEVYGDDGSSLEDGLEELASHLSEFKTNDVIALLDGRKVDLIGDPLAGAALLYRSTCHIMVAVAGNDPAGSNEDSESPTVSLPKMPRNGLGRFPDASCVVGYAGAINTVVTDKRIINRAKDSLQKFWRQAFLKSILAAKRGVEWPLIGLDYWGEACIGEGRKEGRPNSKPCFRISERHGAMPYVFASIGIALAVLVAVGLAVAITRSKKTQPNGR